MKGMKFKPEDFEMTVLHEKHWCDANEHDIARQANAKLPELIKPLEDHIKAITEIAQARGLAACEAEEKLRIAEIALSRIEATDLCEFTPTGDWYIKWRNQTKENARQALARIRVGVSNGKAAEGG
jgi:hypothetical protein